MTREELITRLELLVRENKLSIDEAQGIVERYDAGAFSESELPLTRKEQLQRFLAITAAMSGAQYLATALQRAGNTSGSTVRLSVVDLFNERAGDVTTQIWSDDSPMTRTFQSDMEQLIVDNAISMARLGAGRELTAAERRRIVELLKPQWAYLERFSDEIAFRAASGRPYSERYIYDRSRQYGGFALGLFYRLQETRFEGLRGWVAKYIPVDDPGTCIPCHEAGIQGPYLPGEGPFPGEVCVARGKCRCEREMIYDITAWRILSQRLPQGRLIA